MIGVQVRSREGRRCAAAAALATTCGPPRTPAGRSSGDRARVLSSLSGIDLDARTHRAPPDARPAPTTGAARVAALAFRVTQPELTTAAGARARRDDGRQQADDEPRRLLRQPRLQRRAAREAARRRDRQAGRDVLLQHHRRPAHGRARLQGGPGDRERRARAVDRRRRLPGGDDGLRRRVLRRLRDRRTASTTRSTSRTTRSGSTRPSPTPAPTSRSSTTRANAIVIKATADSQTMTVAFLSRPLGRHVEQTTSAQTAYTNPKKRFYASPDAAAGQIAQTTVGEKGFQVTVSRTVTRRRRQAHPRGQLPVALHPRGRDLPRRQGRHAARRARRWPGSTPATPARRPASISRTGSASRPRRRSRPSGTPPCRPRSPASRRHGRRPAPRSRATRRRRRRRPGADDDRLRAERYAPWPIQTSPSA